MHVRTRGGWYAFFWCILLHGTAAVGWLQTQRVLQPEECLDERRTKSKTEMDRCNQIFQDLDYSLELLTKCGLITVNG